MSGETEKDVSGLTTDTLKLLVDSEFRRIDERFAAFLNTYGRDQEKANEFRSALDDLGKQMATRRETEQRLDAMNQQISDLRSRLDVGPSGLTQLQLAQAQQSGVTVGKESSLTSLYALIAAVGAVIAIVVVLANVLTH